MSPLAPSSLDLGPPGAPSAPVALSLAVIGPDDARRSAMVRALLDSGQADSHLGGVRPLAVQEFHSYPFELERSVVMIEQYFDVVLIDLDSDPEYALKVVAESARSGNLIVMVYSAGGQQVGREQVIRAVRAGAREFLTLPLAAGEIAEALTRIPVRQPVAPLIATSAAVNTPAAPAVEVEPVAAITLRAPQLVPSEPAPHRGLYVFQGAKGGCGVTTIAATFAVALAQDSGQSTLLIDLGAPLGDAAIQLGLLNDYSTATALNDSARLDDRFLRSLLVQHHSGLQVLAAPTELPAMVPCTSAAAGQAALTGSIDKLIAVARRAFAHVVVDIGSRVDLMDSSLFANSASLYLVTEVGVSELRNAHRMLTQFFTVRGHKPQIVLNRYTSRTLGFGEGNVARALARPAQWKIPDEDQSAGRNRRTVAELELEHAGAFRAIRLMARTACGLPALPGKRRAFGLFGVNRATFGRGQARRNFSALATSDHDESRILEAEHQPNRPKPTLTMRLRA